MDSRAHRLRLGRCVSLRDPFRIVPPRQSKMVRPHGTQEGRVRLQRAGQGPFRRSPGRHLSQRRELIRRRIAAEFVLIHSKNEARN